MDERQILYSGYIVISVLIFVTILMFVNKAVDDTLFKERTKIADLALTFNSIISSPSDVVIEDGLNDYTINIDNQCAITTGSIKDTYVREEYLCVNDNNLQFVAEDNIKNVVVFSKDNNNVNIYSKKYQGEGGEFGDSGASQNY